MFGAEDVPPPAAGSNKRLAASLTLAVSVLLHLLLLTVLATSRRSTSVEDRPVGVLLFGRPLEMRVSPPSPADQIRERQREAMARTLVQPAPPAAEPTGPPSPASELLAPLEAGGAVTRPEVIESTRVLPAYPKAAERMHLVGDLVLRAEIDERGHIDHLEIVRGLPYGLNEASLAAVRRWRFHPSTRDGRPVRVRYLLILHFRPPPEQSAAPF
jgi:TonB family protein